MSIVSQFSLGIRTYSKSFQFMHTHGLSVYLLYPLLINLFVLVGIYWMTDSVGDFISNYLLGWFDFEHKDFFMSQYLGGFLSGLLSFIFALLSFIIFAFVGGYVVLIIMSPILSTLSEKTEEKLTGASFDSSFSQTISDILRGLGIAIRNLIFELVILLAAFLISFIPVVGLAVPFALFFISAYLYGFSFMDFTNERRRYDVKTSIRNIRKNKGMAMGNGVVYALCLLVPIAGSFLATFMAVFSTVAATLAMHDAAYQTEGDKI